jgi:hypothetical protein
MGDDPGIRRSLVFPITPFSVRNRIAISAAAASPIRPRIDTAGRQVTSTIRKAGRDSHLPDIAGEVVDAESNPQAAAVVGLRYEARSDRVLRAQT